MDVLERLAGGLLLVIGMIWIGAYLYSRLYGFNNRGERNLVRIVTNNPIGPKKAITVVEIAGEYLVLGMTPDQITYLTRIKDPEIVEMMLKKSQEVSESGVLKNIFNKGFKLRMGLKNERV